MSRFKGKPIGGLPGPLPAGEDLLWQGAPDWRALARRAFRVRIIGAYFAGLIALRVGASLATGASVSVSLGTGVTGLTLGLVSVSMFCVYAWLISKSTTYSITSKRVVITYGMALPKSVNLPFSRIDAADLAVHEAGTGDIVLRLPGQVRLSYLLLWPHVHGGKNGRAEPVLRAIDSPRETAKLLASAIGGTLAATEQVVVTTPSYEPANAMRAHAA